MTDHHEDAATDLLIKEVDEELRQEQLSKVWKKYANLIGVAAIAVVLAVAGWQAWHAWQTKQALASSQRFGEALRLAEQGKLDDASTGLGRLAVDGTAGYRVLAALRLAALREQAGDVEGAAATYRGIAERNGIDVTYRNLATLKAAYLSLDGGDADQIATSVEPLSQEASPWRHSAREILGLVALKKGDTAKAIAIFKKLADDVAAPQGVRSRATEMLAAQPSQAKG